MTKRRKAINYLSNKELLKEIHKSKTTFCEFEQSEFSLFDIIVEDINNVNDEIIEQAKINKAKYLNNQITDKLIVDGLTNAEISSYIANNGHKPDDFSINDIVVRVMMNDHIPMMKDKKGKIVKTPVIFPAFQHFKFKDNEWTSVGKSHFKDGKFSQKHGTISRNLGNAYMMIVDRYSKRSNWRNYTYLEEMRGQALLRLSQAGLMFNEFKSSNPFAYFTTIINHSFTHVLNKEKEGAAMKNKMIQDCGYNPSFSDQAGYDINNYARDQGYDE